MCGRERKPLMLSALFPVRHICIDGGFILHEMTNLNIFKWVWPSPAATCTTFHLYVCFVFCCWCYLYGFVRKSQAPDGASDSQCAAIVDALLCLPHVWDETKTRQYQRAWPRPCVALQLLTWERCHCPLWHHKAQTDRTLCFRNTLERAREVRVVFFLKSLVIVGKHWQVKSASYTTFNDADASF